MPPKPQTEWSIPDTKFGKVSITTPTICMESARRMITTCPSTTGPIPHWSIRSYPYTRSSHHSHVRADCSPQDEISTHPSISLSVCLWLIMVFLNWCFNWTFKQWASGMVSPWKLLHLTICIFCSILREQLRPASTWTRLTKPKQDPTTDWARHEFE